MLQCYLDFGQNVDFKIKLKFGLLILALAKLQCMLPKAVIFILDEYLNIRHVVCV